MRSFEDMAARLLEEPLMPLPSISSLQRRTARRHRRRLVGGASTLLGVGVVVALVIALLPASSVGGHGGQPSARLASYLVPATQVSDATLDQIGLPSQEIAPTALSGRAVLTEGGAPTVVYVGGEFCPYCAVTRWALVVALSKFGTFSNLGRVVSSASSDVYPGLKSWSFHDSSYSSPYIRFDPAEILSGTRDPADNSFTPLDTMSPLQRDAFDSLDAAGSFPFVDIGNRYLAIGAGATPSVLQGLSLDQIAGSLNDPSSPVAQALDGSANYLIAGICSIIGQQGPSICSSSFVAAAQSQMSG